MGLVTHYITPPRLGAARKVLSQLLCYQTRQAPVATLPNVKSAPETCISTNNMRSNTSPEVIRKLNARTEQTCDELAAVDAELMQLQARQKQLEHRRWRLEHAKFCLQRQTHAWNFNRKLERFLHFPPEIREIIYSYYFPSTDTFAEGCKNIITLVSQQIRDEVIDWLGR